MNARRIRHGLYGLLGICAAGPVFAAEWSDPVPPVLNQQVVDLEVLNDAQLADLRGKAGFVSIDTSVRTRLSINLRAYNSGFGYQAAGAAATGAGSAAAYSRPGTIPAQAKVTRFVHAGYNSAAAQVSANALGTHTGTAAITRAETLSHRTYY